MPSPSTTPTPRTPAGTTCSPATQWYDGYLHLTFEPVGYEQWLRPAA
ncbi:MULTISPECIES: hypothetical protein [Streptomyces]|nr:hypothetical protein [Streptomyces sp. NRRL F-5193]